jgi:hypothetical protein
MEDRSTDLQTECDEVVNESEGISPGFSGPSHQVSIFEHEGHSCAEPGTG